MMRIFSLSSALKIPRNVSVIFVEMGEHVWAQSTTTVVNVRLGLKDHNVNLRHQTEISLMSQHLKPR